MPNIIEQRQELTSMFIREAVRCGLDGLEVASKQASGRPGKRRVIRGDPHYSLRSVLPSQVTFDVDTTDWDEVRRITHAVWNTLERWRVPYWGALTGGKGTHTTVFVRPHADAVWDDEDETWRLEPWKGSGVEGWDPRGLFVDALVSYVCNEFFDPVDLMTMDSTGVGALCLDHRYLFPGPRKRIIREFGAKHPSTGDRKTLWQEGGDGSVIRHLPPTRTEAYNKGQVVIPSALPVSVRPPGVRHRAIADAMGRECPRSTACLPRPENGCSRSHFCGRCPAMR